MGETSERVHTVLFDADGLLQHPEAGWVERLSRFDADDPEGFLLELWAAERPALEGKESLIDSVRRLLAARGLDEAQAQAVCDLWDNIEVDDEAWQLVRDVAAAGVRCHLATNQQSYRRDLMIDLGYGDLVEEAFYSCDLGHAKPDPAYFRAILDRLGVGPEGIVFVDDRPDNVEAAASVGLSAHVHDPASGADGLRGVLRAAGVAGA